MGSFSFRKFLGKAVKFCTSSLIGTGVDTLVLWIFSTWVFMSYTGKYIFSPCISFECAVLTNFTIAYFFIWKDRIKRRSPKSFWLHFAAYNASSAGMFLIKMLLLLGIERLFGLNAILCNLGALCVTGILNFFMNELVIFRNKKTV